MPMKCWRTWKDAAGQSGIGRGRLAGEPREYPGGAGKLEEIIQDRTRNMPASLEEGRETDEEALEDGAEERDE